MPLCPFRQRKSSVNINLKIYRLQEVAEVEKRRCQSPGKLIYCCFGIYHAFPTKDAAEDALAALIQRLSIHHPSLLLTMGLDNANPTILSESELSSHRQRRKGNDARSGKQSLRDVFISKPSFTMDPFYMSEFSDTDSDDSTMEPIDEQEIYGTLRSHFSFLMLCVTPVVIILSHPLDQLLADTAVFDVLNRAIYFWKANH